MRPKCRILRCLIFPGMGNPTPVPLQKTEEEEKNKTKHKTKQNKTKHKTKQNKAKQNKNKKQTDKQTNKETNKHCLPQTDLSHSFLSFQCLPVVQNQYLVAGGIFFLRWGPTSLPPSKDPTYHSQINSCYTHSAMVKK